METETSSANKYTTIRGRQVRSCELRIIRRVADTEGRERVEYICGASGGPEKGYALGSSDDDGASLAAICNACPIPDVLESKQSCLQLVPVRHFVAGKRPLPVIQPGDVSNAATCNEPTEAYFPCRWFYTLFGQKQPRDTLMCQSCPYWFPRPPLELIPGYWNTTQKMVRIVTGEERIEMHPTGFRLSQETPPKTLWEKLRRKIHL